MSTPTSSSVAGKCAVCGRRPLASGVCGCPDSRVPSSAGDAAAQAPLTADAAEADLSGAAVSGDGAAGAGEVGTGPRRAYSSYEQVTRRLHEEQAAMTWQDRYVRPSQTTFGLWGKIVLTLPIVIVTILFFAMRLYLSPLFWVLMISGWGGWVYYAKSVWVARR